MNALVWMFRDHRELFERAHRQELQLERLVDRTVVLEADNKKLAQALSLAEDAIKSNPTYINSVIDLIKHYNEQTLKDLPFAEGEEPEWLTPETLERAERNDS